MENIQHLVGKITHTDNKASMDIVAYVEVKPDRNRVCDPLLFLNINPYNSKSVNMKFNNIEMRAFAYTLQEPSAGYRKMSGGKDSACMLTVYTRSSTCYIGLARGADKAEISFSTLELLGLSWEIRKLCDVLSDALYKTQQFEARKKSSGDSK